MRRPVAAAGPAALFLLCACAGVPDEEGPALLTEEGVDAARTALSAALGRATITLGEPSATTAPVLVVLPPRPGPYEANSPALPLRFDVRSDAEGCRLVPEADGRRTLTLPKSACRPVPPR
ncbi:hypothetical protein [Parvularcula dongshanensis]|uniref:Secreted protein n=1 Tax=Parvularcula dongshanensis TaxID=1173995 RepID=A0A840I0R5_9PROT|nr:hypothetical protein [Parvularcula dongshanensis]MBB4658317.1 hypothetical protein [Parvularcula dongshanensis]